MAKLSDDRVLHIANQEHYNKVEKFAEENGILDRFKIAMEYLRTFSGGSEIDYMTLLFPDTPGDPGNNFVARILRKNQIGDFIDWFTIGCIYRENERDWSMHS